jgi:tetratricopeptide (TPR) repeat protein
VTAVSVTEKDRHARVAELAKQIASRNAGSAENSAETDKLYVLDSALRSDNVTSLGSAKIEQLLQEYPDSADVLRLAAVYFARTAQYDRALGYAENLLKRDSGVTNCILYTDIIAQQAAMGASNASSADDPEAAALTAKAKQLSEQAAKTDTSTPSGADRAAELKVQAQDLLTQAARLPVKRAINFVLSREPLFGDSTGMLDLQLAKLYLAAGDRSTAKTYIWKVIGRSGSISDTSPIKQALGDVTAAVNQLGSSSDFESPLLSSAIERLVRAQSSGAAAASGEDLGF